MSRLPRQPRSIRAEVEALTARLEELVGMNPRVQGEDLGMRRNDLNNQISQVTDPQLYGRIQAILNSLEPLQTELSQREATMAPISQQYEAIRAEGERAWQARHDQLQSELGPRWADIHNRINAESDKRGNQFMKHVQDWANELTK